MQRLVLHRKRIESADWGFIEHWLRTNCGESPLINFSVEGRIRDCNNGFWFAMTEIFYQIKSKIKWKQPNDMWRRKKNKYSSSLSLFPFFSFFLHNRHSFFSSSLFGQSQQDTRKTRRMCPIDRNKTYRIRIVQPIRLMWRMSRMDFFSRKRYSIFSWPSW